MSASSNADAMTPAQGEFRSKVPRSEPMTTSGHKAGVKVGNDAAPEFSAQTLPAGTAPPESTFTPNTQSEIPGQAMNPNIAKETWTKAEDTIPGATSADVHTGFGQPGQGQTSQELRGHDAHNKDRSGVAFADSNIGDTRERGLDRDHVKGGEGMAGHGTGEARFDYKGAEDREPVSAESVAAERD